MILTERSHSSAQLSFDRFLPAGRAGGYVASWRVVGSSGAWSTQQLPDPGEQHR